MIRSCSSLPALYCGGRGRTLYRYNDAWKGMQSNPVVGSCVNPPRTQSGKAGCSDQTGLTPVYEAFCGVDDAFVADSDEVGIDRVRHLGAHRERDAGPVARDAEARDLVRDAAQVVFVPRLVKLERLLATQTVARESLSLARRFSTTDWVQRLARSNPGTYSVGKARMWCL